MLQHFIVLFVVQLILFRLSLASMAQMGQGLFSAPEEHAEKDTVELYLASVNSNEDKENEYIRLIKQASCQNITQAEWNLIVPKLPNIRIRCELEKTILSPKSLRNYGRVSKNPFGPKNVEDEQEDLNEDVTKNVPKKHSKDPKHPVLELIESGARLEVDQVQLRFPVVPCVRPRTSGKGHIEVYITLSNLNKRMKEISGTVPFIDMQLGRAQFFTNSRDFVYSTTCAYQDHAVRPAVEIVTEITLFQTRMWEVELGHSVPIIKKSDWKNETVAELAESTVVLSCLSERYVPDICAWTEEDAMAKVFEILEHRQLKHS